MLLKKTIFLLLVITCNVLIYSAEPQAQPLNLVAIANARYQEKIAEKLKFYDFIIEREKKFIDKINDKEGKKYISILSQEKAYEQQMPKPSQDDIIKFKLTIVDAAKKATFQYIDPDDRCYSKLASTDAFLYQSNSDIADLPDKLLDMSITPEFAYFFQQNLLYPDTSAKPSPESIGLSKDSLDITSKLTENFRTPISPQYIGLLNVNINPYATENIRKNVSPIVSTYLNKALCTQTKQSIAFMQKLTSGEMNTPQGDTPTQSQQLTKEAQPILPTDTPPQIPVAPQQQPSLFSAMRNRIFAAIMSTAIGSMLIYQLHTNNLMPTISNWWNNLWSNIPTEGQLSK